MTAIVVIGDELNSLGFRLAGVDTLSPSAGDLQAVFAQALASATLVVLTRPCADALPAGELARALLGEHPLVLVLPDIRSPEPDSDAARRLRGVLGIAA